MPHCCVCQFNVRNPRDIFTERIGNPPILISDLVLRCTRGSGFELSKESSICKKCLEKLLRYHKSIELAKQVRREILDLIRSPYIIEEYKLNRGEVKIEDESEEIGDFLYEIERDVDPVEVDKTEDIVDEEQEEKDNFQLIEHEELENEIIVEDLVEEVDDMERLGTDSNNVDYEEHLFEGDDDFETTQELIKDELTHNALGEIQCPDCDLTFMNKRKYNAHAKREHFPGYVCDQCGKTLHSYSGFIGHLQNHEPIKQFECPECGEKFNRKFRLKHHMAWHTGETPFQCEICSKRFVHKVALYKHKMIHNDETKRIECQVCGFKFRTKAHLDRHMRSHTGAKPFSCPVCKKTFSQMYNMKAHLREHENPGCNRQRRFRCTKCAHTFTNEQHFLEHCQLNDCLASIVKLDLEASTGLINV